MCQNALIYVWVPESPACRVYTNAFAKALLKLAPVDREQAKEPGQGRAVENLYISIESTCLNPTHPN